MIKHMRQTVHLHGERAEESAKRAWWLAMWAAWLILSSM